MLAGLASCHLAWGRCKPEHSADCPGWDSAPCGVARDADVGQIVGGRLHLYLYFQHTTWESSAAHAPSPPHPRCLPGPSMQALNSHAHLLTPLYPHTHTLPPSPHTLVLKVISSELEKVGPNYLRLRWALNPEYGHTLHLYWEKCLVHWLWCTQTAWGLIQISPQSQ